MAEMLGPLVAAGLLLTALGCGPEAAPGKSQGDTVATPKRAIVPLEVLDDRLAICRLESTQALPDWARGAAGEFFSVTRTPQELSIIVADTRAPKETRCERGWRLIGVRGSLDFNQVGIIAGMSGTLADAGISIFAVSTYDTDYIMVKQNDLSRAVAALRKAGYSVTES